MSEPSSSAATVRALLVEAFMAMPEHYDWPNDNDDHYYSPSVGHVADVAVEALIKAGLIQR